MKNQNLISVVIPVYNTRKIHIEECLDRVLHQTYKNIEVMVIDDGSRRVLARHLDNISKKDKRIKVIHQQNTGTNRARQIGFIKSTGSYVTFVDSDDLIEKSMISRLLQACLDNEADMSICEYWDDVNTKKTPNPWTNSQDVLDGKDAISRCRYAGFPKMRHVGAVWARMYKRSILEKIDWDFSDYTVTEDEFMNIQIFANANKAVCIPRQLYYYRQQVATSKEMNYPAHNTRKGQKIPMLQTASDLYEKSKQVYGAKNIKYNEIELTQNYIAILGK